MYYSWTKQIWYNSFVGKFCEYENMLDKVLGKIKEIIGTEKFDDTKILVDTEDKLPDDITLKSVVIMIMC